MKLVIAGSRHFSEETADILISYACAKLRFHGSEPVDTYAKGVQHTEITEVVSGGAQGIDQGGERWAKSHWVKLQQINANWELGKNAGRIRNKIMANYGDALLLIWDGKSPGSRNMREEMKKMEKPVYEVVLKGPSLLVP